MARAIWNFANVKHAYSLFYYNRDGDTQKLIHDLKYKGMSDLAFYMGQYLGREAMKKGMHEHCDLLVPVPTTKTKLRQRGYNQAERIAQGIGSVFNSPVVNLLKKKFNRETQTHLTFEERRQNAHGLYTANIPPQWQGKRILIVDDVLTSGSTIGNCASAIEEADPTAEISAITLCFTSK